MPPTPKMVQIALCSDDLPRTVQLYTEAFGFAEAGGRVMWGERVAKIQGLGADTAFTLWWLVGRQDFFQLEVFQHTEPRQRPRSATARPSDLGWVRWGFAVPDFDAALTRLVAFGIVPLTAPAVVGGLRRVCFRDPQVGVVVELLEDGPALPGGPRPRFYDLAPAAVYATISVADLQLARRLYVETIGMAELPLEVLHDPGSEALWGLDGARREGFLAAGGDMFLEVVRYTDPVPRPQDPDARLSDQGIMNAAVGYRDRADVAAAYARAQAAGFPPSQELSPSGATYLGDGQGETLEILAVPREMDEPMGFVPRPTFPPPSRWPRATTAPASSPNHAQTVAAERTTEA